MPFINGDIEDRYDCRLQAGRLASGMPDFSPDPMATNGTSSTTSATRWNASIANYDLLHRRAGSPTAFNAGGFVPQLTTNADFSRFSGCGERYERRLRCQYRRENHQIFAGELGSYNDADGVGFGGNAGSQFPSGFQPGDATSKSRNSVAGYVDVETDPPHAPQTRDISVARRALQRLRFHAHRQGGATQAAIRSCCVAQRAPASRVVAAGLLLVDIYRLHQRPAAR